MFRMLLTAVFLALIGGLMLLSPPLHTAAQTTEPELWITWRTETYVPPSYQGKRLPVPFASIVAGVELIDNGKLVDLKNQRVYWYVDDQFITGGLGVQTAVFRVPEMAGKSVDLRVQLPDYLETDFVTKTVVVPVVRPEAVIEIPYPGRSVPGRSATLYGRPYFFNALDANIIEIFWKVNDKPPDATFEPEKLELALAPEAPTGVPVSAKVSLGFKNLYIPLEASFTDTAITFNP